VALHRHVLLDGVEAGGEVSTDRRIPLAEAGNNFIFGYGAARLWEMWLARYRHGTRTSA
jgi:hypothetical protein